MWKHRTPRKRKIYSEGYGGFHRIYNFSAKASLPMHAGRRKYVNYPFPVLGVAAGTISNNISALRHMGRESEFV